MIFRMVRTKRGHRGDERIETDYPCSTIRKVFWDNGIDIILYDVGGDPRKEVKLEMPQDGKRGYVMNDDHDTVDSLSWPLHRKEKDDARDAAKEEEKKDESKDDDVAADDVPTPELRVMVCD